jgi:4-hydroxy-tetrahydrodipicolinate synthase
MKKISGLYTALITPFDQKGKLDEKGLKTLIEEQLLADVDGVCMLGTTAETPTLSEKERKKILEIAVKAVKGKSKNKTRLMVGTGGNCTSHVIERTQEAEAAGADSCLVVVPYYNRPTQEGLYLHFKAVANATKLPIVLYNVPARTGQNLEVKTVAKLAAIPNIVGIKEASGNISQIMDLIAETSKVKESFSVLSGDDALALPLIALGGCGLISVVSNLLPKMIKLMVENALEGDFDGARSIHYKLLPVFRAAFIETNPAPLKTLMNLSDLPAGPCRLPLAPLSQENHHLIEQLMVKFQGKARVCSSRR